MFKKLSIKRLRNALWRRNKSKIIIKSAKIDIIKHKEVSPYYNAIISKGVFRERPENVNEHFKIEVIKRIIKAYNSSQSAFANVVDPAYRIGKEWQGILGDCYNPLSSSLASKDVDSLKRLFGNFGRSKLSRGFELGSDFDYFKKNGFDADYINRYLRRIHIWLAMVSQKQDLSELSFPLIGNPQSIAIEGNLIPMCGPRLHYYSTRIVELSVGNNIEHSTVLEIGGGFGGMAYYLLKNNPGRFKYLNFDLPVIISICSYFLMLAFPKLKVLLYGEDELSPESIESHDIVLMPHFELPKIKDRSIDISFNSNSLIEMDEQAIAEYLRQITRITKHCFLHNNYLHGDYDSNLVYNGKVSKKFSLLTGKYLANGDWRRSYLFPSLFDVDFYECLYKRA